MKGSPVVGPRTRVEPTDSRQQLTWMFKVSKTSIIKIPVDLGCHRPIVSKPEAFVVKFSVGVISRFFCMQAKESYIIEFIVVHTANQKNLSLRKEQFFHYNYSFMQAQQSKHCFAAYYSLSKIVLFILNISLLYQQ